MSFSFLEKHDDDGNEAQEVLIAALNAWGLVHSKDAMTLDTVTTFMDSHMPLLMSIARSTDDDSDMELRTCVSENMMLLVSAIHETETQVLYQDVLDLLLELYQSWTRGGGSKKIKKSTRKDQRQLGREYLEVLTEPTYTWETEFQVGEEVLKFYGWSCRLQMRHLKRVLKSGFQDHFQYNGQMRAFFDLSRPEEEGDPFEEEVWGF